MNMPTQPLASGPAELAAGSHALAFLPCLVTMEKHAQGTTVQCSCH